MRLWGVEPASSSGDGGGSGGEEPHWERLANLVVVHADRARLGKRLEVPWVGFKMGGLHEDFVISEMDGVAAEITSLPLGSVARPGWSLIPGNKVVELNWEPADGPRPLKTRDYIEVENVGFVFLCGEALEGQYRELIYRLTVEDFGVGLSNGRYLSELLEREEIRAARHQMSLSVAVVNFCTVDGGGKAVRRAMRRFGQGLVGRPCYSVVARLGETEMGVVCAETIQRVLREELEQHARRMAALPAGDAVPIPRIGVASWSADLSGNELLDKARGDCKIQSA